MRMRFGGYSAPAEMDIVLAVGKNFGIDEALSIYTSKIYVNDWVSMRHKCNTSSCSHMISPDQTRKILGEYSKAVLVIGKKIDDFKTAVLAMEKELYNKGYYKAFALINGPCDFCSNGKNSAVLKRPSFEIMGIDILATIRKFKKNVEQPKEGEIPPYAIILVE